MDNFPRYGEEINWIRHRHSETKLPGHTGCYGFGQSRHASIKCVNWKFIAGYCFIYGMFIILSTFFFSVSFAPHAVTDATINSKWLYEYVAAEWSTWLPQSALDTLRIGGYYTFVIKPHLRVVALNNNLCFTFNM